MKKKDWVGKKIDMLTITQNIDCEFVIASCDCGSGERRYRKNKFRKKFFKSCGCARIKDETGKTYGPFFIIKDRVGKNGSRGNICEARCSCGNVFKTTTRQIVKGSIKTCGCKGMPNETGNTYNGMTIIKDGLFKNGTHRKKCIVQCRCGKVFEAFTRNVVNGRTKSCRCMTYRSANIRHDAFDDPNEESLYWAGFIAADGCVYKGAVVTSLQLGDMGHLEKLKTWVNSDVKVRKTKINACTFIMETKRIEDGLKKYSIESRKSLTYSPPAFCIESVDFWRGMVDGDGWICRGERPIIGLCGTIETCVGFKDFVSKFLDSKVNVCKDRSIFKITYTGPKAIQIMKVLYGNNPKFYLDRKYELANKFCNFPLADDSGII